MSVTKRTRPVELFAHNAMKKLFVLALLELCLSSSAMSSDVETFFPEIRSNLTKLTWDHAVNSRNKLEAALNSSVMMLEADVVIGIYLVDNTSNVPVMAHPPLYFSDLSLEVFLNEVFNFNLHNPKGKGVKLDFKTIEALDKSVEVINAIYSNATFPIWINSDILAGPFNATSLPVDPTQFFVDAKNFARSTLSTGWTTNLPAGVNASYTDWHIDSMLSTLTQNDVSQPITFPVRAGIAAESKPQVERLVNSRENSTITIWSSVGDEVNVENLRSVIKSVGLNRTFIDVPTELEDQLHLDEL